jgi:squalene synthase HpnC
LHLFGECAEIDDVVGSATRVNDGREHAHGTGETGVADEGVANAGGTEAGDGGSAEAIALAAVAKASAENFPVALRVLPARYRRHLTAFYGFARLADDIGDEAPPVARPRLLDELTADVARMYGPTPQTPAPQTPASQTPASQLTAPQLPVMRTLATTVAECGIPEQPFLDLIEANRQDQVVARYQTFDDLVGYCELSANPVGRVVLNIFGVATAERAILSDNICTALQLVEHLQDVAEDLRDGRIYLPQEDMERFGCTEDDLAATVTGTKVRALIAFEAQRAKNLLDEGAPLVGTLRGAARLAVAGYLAGGRAALAAIKASGNDVLRITPRPDKRRLIGEVVRAYLRGR